MNYGYIKVSKWLKEKGFKINKKKVYRLMKENKLLYTKIKPDRTGKEYVKYRKVKAEKPFSNLQVDLKYIHIHGQNRNALLLTIIDVYSRMALTHRLAWSVNKTIVKNAFEEVLRQYSLPDKVTVRNDNGSQFEAKLVRDFFAEMNINQEFTHVATPQENAYIESFHSIVEATVCKCFEFENLEKAKEKFNSFMKFYNQERIHSGINYQTPIKFLQNREQSKKSLSSR